MINGGGGCDRRTKEKIWMLLFDRRYIADVARSNKRETDMVARLLVEINQMNSSNKMHTQNGKYKVVKVCSELACFTHMVLIKIHHELLPF